MSTHETRPSTSATASTSTVPAKRGILKKPSTQPQDTVSSEPPKKLQRVGPVSAPVAVSSSSAPTAADGVPILRVNAAASKVPIPVRQALLKTLYDHYVILYQALLPRSPSLAAEHALKQEEEVYNKSTKLTYRNAVIQCVAALKRRLKPDSLSHPSVGTEDEIAARAEAKKSLNALHLTRKLVEPYVMSMEQLEKWGYFIAVPDQPGGTEPSLEGKLAKCERCAQQFKVKRMEEADVCTYHWGRPVTSSAGREKTRIFTCCARPWNDGEGCTKGPHVFHETDLELLHLRHPFSKLQPRTTSSTALDVVAIDCEMISTTGGSRVARVSVVDGSGNMVYDELVRMDEDVAIIDYLTRFSGITAEQHAKAVLPLASVRKTLESLIDEDTIILGHALDNDLKTLRIIHHKCVDTAVLFVHRRGAPYRRALKDLAREHLERNIQQGDSTVGHSSLEDAIATLDLVRWYTLNEGRLKPNARPKSVKPSATSSTNPPPKPPSDVS